jgi:TRAP transporter 4TM/12TM fusion protein
LASDSDEPTGKYRPLEGRLRTAYAAMLIGLAALGGLWSLEVHNLLALQIFKAQFLALIFAVAMAAVFVGAKTHKGQAGGRVPWYDWLAAAASLVTGLYVVVHYPTIQLEIGALTPERVTLGAVAIALVIEATRRLVGWTLVILAGTLILYTKFSDHFGGMLNAPSAHWDQIAAYLYLDTNGMFGLPLEVTSTIIIAFILFGRMLYAVNGDKFLTDFAMLTMGRYRGGAAKVAVVASSLFGTVSGSAVSNVVMDGPITIPMMRRSGYPAHMAAAIEAVASTGGQFMPPVMGITAFIIAEYLQVAYGEVILAALIPALLYYVALFLQVDLEAAKRGLAGAPRSALPEIGPILRRCWVFVIPITVLLWTLLVELWQPGRSAMAAVICAAIVGACHADTRPSGARLLQAFAETGRTILELVVITAIAGLVIGSLQLSGLASGFSMLLVFTSDGSLLTLLMLTAAVCIVLGMGMPTAVIYMMLAVLVAPALVEFKVPAMAAHLFLFYFGMLSMITPPVCLATFAAATIAESTFWRTGWAGMRLGIVAYIVPFVMVYQPGMVFEGSVFDIAATSLTALIGVGLLSVAVVGYLFAPVGIVARGLYGVSGLTLMLAPLHNATGMAVQAASVAVAAVLLWFDRPARRPTGAGETAGGTGPAD